MSTRWIRGRASSGAGILATPVDDDGLIFRLETLRDAAAREDDEYSGIRLDFIAELAGARLPMHIDIGYGDAITPGPVDIEYPSLMGQPAAKLKAYPPQTVVAEKFQAMVALDMLNSRMKDFFDLWAIAGAFAFDGPVLARAIQTTFERRATPLPTETPMALSASFVEAKQVQWAALSDGPKSPSRQTLSWRFKRASPNLSCLQSEP